MRPILLTLLAFAAAGTLRAQRDIGRVDVLVDSRTIPVRVTADRPQLAGLALEAFDSDGRYRVVAGGYVYDMRFSLAGPDAVRVEVTRGATGDLVVDQTVAGTGWRNALLRAADVAVDRTNGLGLRGYFASQLVFVGERTGHKEIYTGDLFFGNVRQITDDRSIAMAPHWGPYGRRILYTSFYHSGFPDIFLINLASDERTIFASYRGTNTGAAFSPDGGRVAMVLSGTGETQIYLANAEGRRITRLTRFDSAKASPCWSPDGSRIVFASEPGPQLYLMSASGGTVRRLTYGISSYCAEPSWSRGDPNKIAFTIGVGRPFHYQIAVYDFATGRSHQVSDAPFDAIEPCWLPDGRHLVYTARTAYQSRICILDTETGKSTPVSPLGFGPAEEADVWSAP
jgi:TolB protein